MDNKVMVTDEQVKHFIRRMGWSIFILIAVGALTLLVGMVVPAISKAPACNSVSTGSMLGVWFSNMGLCTGETVWKLVLAVIGVLVAFWLAMTCSTEDTIKSVGESFFIPDGNDSPVILMGIYAFFILATMATAPYTAPLNFVLNVLFRVVRNVLLGVVFNIIAIRFTGVRSAADYLSEIVTPNTNGMVIYQGVVLIVTFFVGKWLLGG